jgi:hypothetical protein
MGLGAAGAAFFAAVGDAAGLGAVEAAGAGAVLGAGVWAQRRAGRKIRSRCIASGYHLSMRRHRYVFELPPGTPPLTNEVLDEWEKADQEEEYRRAFSPRR